MMNTMIFEWFRQYYSSLVAAPLKIGTFSLLTVFVISRLIQQIIKGQLALRRIRNETYPKITTQRPRRTIGDLWTGLLCCKHTRSDLSWNRPAGLTRLIDRGVYMPKNGDVSFCSQCFACFIYYDGEWVPENKLPKRQKSKIKAERLELQRKEKARLLEDVLRMEYGIEKPGRVDSDPNFPNFPGILGAMPGNSSQPPR